LAFIISSKRSFRIVGSPPLNCRAGGATGLLFLRFSSISKICCFVGSYTYPAAAALAKQTGQVRLHLLVMSIMASPVWLLCSGQIPQSRGQPSFVSVLGFSSPVPSALMVSALWYCS